METDSLLQYRDEFPILDRCTYLVSHSLGAMPRGARQGLESYAQAWDLRGVRAWNEGWWSLPVTVGDRVAAVIGAPAGSVAMQPNVTLATALYLSCLEFTAPRNRLVTTAMNFPSLLYLFEGVPGAEVVRVPSEDGVTVDPERIVAAIDERTRLVAISHVLFRSSFIQDAARIAARAREVGAAFLLDAYQSAGTVPLDASALGADAVVGGCLKWLCGGPGAAFLYVRPDLADGLTPRLTGWQAHRDPFAFASPPIERAEGAWRFLHGTPAVPSLMAAEAGLEILGLVGVDRVREKSLRQTGMILERCDREGWPVRTPRSPESRGGTVSIDPPNAYEISRELLSRDVIIDYRPGAGIRLAPHFYTRDQEVSGALDEIVRIQKDGSWKRHQDRARDTVT